MQELAQHMPNAKTASDYRSLADLDHGAGIYTLVCVAAAAGLGLVVGLVIAVATASAHGTAAPDVASIASTHGSSPNDQPAFNTLHTVAAPMLPGKVESKKKSIAPLHLATVSQTTPKNYAGGHKRRRPWPTPYGRQSTARRQPYVSPLPSSAPQAPGALHGSIATVAATPFFVGVEGQATVAAYDEVAGTIQTHEGSNFTLQPASAAGGAIAWDSFPFNVHYRCDEAGNCTLMRGAATELARLTR